MKRFATLASVALAPVPTNGYLPKNGSPAQPAFDVRALAMGAEPGRFARHRPSKWARPSGSLGRATGVCRLAKASATVLATAFILSATPSTASAVPVMATSTPNWSGYGLAGSGFTGVTGTFKVPAPLNSASCLNETAVWVGVDGLDNHDLLQAGIAETGFAPASTKTPPYAPSSGFPGFACSGQVHVYAWWEDLPSGPVPVDLPVKVGDSVTVSIFKMSPGWWVLAIHDLTDNQSFLRTQPYGGPQTSAEWVVEVPQVLGLPRVPVPFRAVHFRDLRAQGKVRDLERLRLTASPGFTSRPDAVAGTAQLIRSGFAVHLTLRQG